VGPVCDFAMLPPPSAEVYAPQACSDR